MANLPFTDEELEIIKLARSLWLHLEEKDNDQIQLDRKSVIDKLKQLEVFED